MLRIRFHGRGGQGMKTASRIVSTAAFREGLSAQDSPIYGAERRGAPVAAFTRITNTPSIDYAVCKGCLICVEECSTHTMHQVREADA